jgi:hypothetical protein
MATLFDLSTEIEKLEIELAASESAEQQEQLMAEYLQNKEDLKIKLENYCGFISELEARAEVRKAEAKRLSDRAAVDANLAKRLKAMLLWYLKENDIKKVETVRYQISKAKNGGKQPLVINEDIPVTSIDERFQKVSIDFDKESIRLALENNEKLDFAYLKEREEGVRIR